jgi:hypothetical protein
MADQKAMAFLTKVIALSDADFEQRFPEGHPMRHSFLYCRNTATATTGDSDDKQELFMNQNPLFGAVLSKDLNQAKVLLKQGSNPNAADPDDGWTPLHHAAVTNHAAMVRLLIKHGAEPHPKDIHGCTPLAEAQLLGHMEVVQALLKAQPLSKEALKEAQGGHLIRSVGSEVPQWVDEHVCAKCGVVSRHRSKCGRCKEVNYCNRECQVDQSGEY